MSIQSKAVELILASASPRRQSLLREAGYEFQVHPADVDEEAIASRQKWTARELAAELARIKAETVAKKFPNSLVLGADTVVSIGQQILGKPRDAADARRILESLSGTTHEVITGVSLVRRSDNLLISRVVVSTVEMKSLDPGDIDAYIASGQWQGKAGAYGIQDQDPFVRRTKGCFTNIMGLPMTTVGEMLKSGGQMRGGFMPDAGSGRLSAVTQAAVADIFALACAAAGWFYLFSSNAARRLAALEPRGRNSLRIALRRICGALLFLLAVACFAGFNTVNDQRNPGAYLAVWAGAILLLMLIIILVAIDIHLTWKLKRERTHKP